MGSVPQVTSTEPKEARGRIPRHRGGWLAARHTGGSQSGTEILSRINKSKRKLTALSGQDRVKCGFNFHKSQSQEDWIKKHDLSLLLWDS